MAVGNFQIAELLPINGIKLAAAAAGIKKADRNDVVLIELDQNTQVATAFTQNLFCAVPVQICKKHLACQMGVRYLLINSGNANAGTGTDGFVQAQNTIDELARLSGSAAEQVLVFSTGVIGQPLPSAKIKAVVPHLLSSLQVDNWNQAAAGIMTTDTHAKGLSKQIKIGAKTVNLTGIAKGVGMLKPNMATMLAFIATDAQIPPVLLQQLLNSSLDVSFNSITVDGDTSTNDSCVLMATGKSQCLIDGSHEVELEAFKAALEQLCIELAHTLVRDGEGATKFVTIQVKQGRSLAQCRQIAFKIAESPLVKTALFASDPNWGRILAAIGNAEVALDVDKVGLIVNGVQIVRHGGLDPNYTEEQGVAAMQPEEIVIEVLLGEGQIQSTVWTTDLSYDYVKINAEYRS